MRRRFRLSLATTEPKPRSRLSSPNPLAGSVALIRDEIVAPGSRGVGDTLERGSAAIDISPSDVIARNGSTIRIRASGPADAPGLAPLLAEFPDARANFSGTRTPASDAVTLVAEGGGRIIGVATFVRRPELQDRAEVGFIVDEAIRSQGVGTRLLERLAEVARSMGVTAFETDLRSDGGRMASLLESSGYPATHRNDGPNTRLVVSLAPTAKYRERAAERSETAAAASIRKLLEPRSVAVIGASRDPGKIGGQILRLLLETGFHGDVFPVNPNADSILGRRAYANARKLPGLVDLAVICVPASGVEAAVDDCLARGAGGIVVISAGFAETGEEGRRRQDAILEKIRTAGIRMVGPNCMGVLNTDPAVRLNATFSSVYPPEGRVALSTQSGALGLALLDHAAGLNLGISSFVSVGNKADVSSNDLLQYWAEDPKTDVILLYLENFGNPRRFTQIARRMARRKPIVAVKSGRSRGGARAASSHTGALAESDSVVDALFRQAGVIRTQTLEEMFDVATLLAHQPVPRGNRVAILTNAGGPAILAADVCEAQGLVLATLSQESTAALRAFLPAAASVANPVDMIASASPEHYERSLRILSADSGIESILTIFIPPVTANAEAVAAAIVAGSRAAAEKTLLATFMTAKGVPEVLRPIPCYPFPESAARALGLVTRYGEWRRRPADQESAPPPGIAIDRVRKIVSSALSRGPGWLSPLETAELLDSCGIPSAPLRVADDGDAAVRAASDIGFPVALKAIGPRILHKTEVGGVRLSLSTGVEVREAFAAMKGRLGSEMSSALVQGMVAGGVEVLVGLTTDSTFGPLVVYGGGGTMVELLADVAFRLCPLSLTDTAEMLDEVKTTALLRGFRGSARADESAVRDLLRRISAMGEAIPEILEMDLNPVKVLEKGLVVVDARIRVGRPAAAPVSRRIVA